MTCAWHDRASNHTDSSVFLLQKLGILTFYIALLTEIHDQSSQVGGAHTGMVK